MSPALQITVQTMADFWIILSAASMVFFVASYYYGENK